MLIILFNNVILPADFPGGKGESNHVGRATPEDIEKIEGRRVMGLEPFEITLNMISGEKQMVSKANIKLHQN